MRLVDSYRVNPSRVSTVGSTPIELFDWNAYSQATVVAVSLGVLFLDEKVSITLLLGAIVVIFGVFLVVRVEARTVETAKPNMEVVQK
jgi:drug/metabolite transporter (DMT)-like permease